MGGGVRAVDRTSQSGCRAGEYGNTHACMRFAMWQMGEGGLWRFVVKVAREEESCGTSGGWLFWDVVGVG